MPIKIILFLMYTVFETIVILRAFFFHLDGQITLRAAQVCNIVGVFLSGICCDYEKNRADLDHTITKISAIIYILFTPQSPFKPITDQLSITRHGTPIFNTANTIGCQLRTKLNPMYIFKICSLLKVNGVLFVKYVSYSGVLRF